MHELKLMDVQKKYKDKEAVRKFNYTFTMVCMDCWEKMVREKQH